jgi:hypothetical protein
LQCITTNRNKTPGEKVIKRERRRKGDSGRGEREWKKKKGRSVKRKC